MDSEYESLKMYSDSTPLINIESKECFICREGDEMGRDGLLHFCDCKNLFAHQKCLLTWIQKSLHNENVPTCKVCTAEYQLEKKSPWRFLATQWHQWVVLCTALVLMISTPFLVYQMIVAFKDPPPGLLFNVAAICVGALTEILLTKKEKRWKINKATGDVLFGNAKNCLSRRPKPKHFYANIAVFQQNQYPACCRSTQWEKIFFLHGFLLNLFGFTIQFLERKATSTYFSELHNFYL